METPNREEVLPLMAPIHHPSSKHILNIRKEDISAWLVTAVFATQDPVVPYKTNRKMT